MANARVFKCPNCGAPTDEQARACGYCLAPVASVRCGYCYHMNIPDAVHCSGCGRDLGLEPLPKTSDLVCPDCKILLDAFRGRTGRLFDCSKCGGQFVEHALLQDLLEQREVYGMSAPQRVRRQNPLNQPVRYLKCPACKKVMNRKNFGKASGVIVDVCNGHGVWLDTGELPRILAFVQQGGLARARQRERERQDRERAADRAASVASVPLAHGTETFDLIGGVCDLIDWLVDGASRVID